MTNTWEITPLPGGTIRAELKDGDGKVIFSIVRHPLATAEETAADVQGMYDRSVAEVPLLNLPQDLVEVAAKIATKLNAKK